MAAARDLSDVDAMRLRLAAALLAVPTGEDPFALLRGALDQVSVDLSIRSVRDVLRELIADLRGRARVADPSRAAGLLAALVEADSDALWRFAERGEAPRRAAGRRLRRAALALRTHECPKAAPSADAPRRAGALLGALAEGLLDEDAVALTEEVGLLGVSPEIAVGFVRRALREALADAPLAVTLSPTLPLDQTSPGAPPRAGAQEIQDTLAGEPDEERADAGRRVGRFTVLHRLGAGNMGVVYAAYDEVLDRKIAVKVLRPQRYGEEAQARLRLLREAQAMAKVSHPNVAIVHEVGLAAEGVYVAMEFIRGQTLHTWLRESPRTWQEIVAAFVQAGRGLAAAHAVQLVHRDFKPSNVMIGDDGRVRVLDFGLVHVAAQLDSSDRLGELGPSDSQRNIALQLTQAGEIMGTPLYMPYEQFCGRTPGPAADQFSFCASLYEALYGEPPFTGEDLVEHVDRVKRFAVAEAPRGSRVPTWLRAALVRGLHTEPKDRHPSMDALLKLLDRDPARSRRRGLTVAGLGVSAALVGFFTASALGPRTACSGGQAELAAAWGSSQRAAVQRALAASGPAFAAELWPRVAAALDGYASDWATRHRDACEAHARGEQSDALLDRRMACLARRKHAFAAAVDVLAGADSEVALQALRVVRDLPTLGRCSDLAALAEDVPPPADPEVARKVEGVRQGLARVDALAHAGRAGEAVALAEQLVREAEAVDYAPVEAEALLQAGRYAADLVRLDESVSLLTAAMLTALGARVDEVAAEALALRIYVRARLPDRVGDALADEPLARTLVQRLPAPDAAMGFLLNNLGTAYLSTGQIEPARAAFRGALAVDERLYGPEDLQLADTLGNLALVEEDPVARVDLLRRALAIAVANLGPAHPQTLEFRLTASHHTPDPLEAHALLSPGCDALARFLPDEAPARARCLYYVGRLSAEAGDDGAAAAALGQARALVAGVPDSALQPMLPAERALLLGYAALHTGHDAAAIDGLRRALAEVQCPSHEQWWVCLDRAELALVLGLNLRAASRHADALTPLQEAVELFAAIEPLAHDAIVRQRRAAAELALADLLVALPPVAVPKGAPGRAAALAARAAAWYRAGGPAYAGRVQQAAVIETRARDMM